MNWAATYFGPTQHLFSSRNLTSNHLTQPSSPFLTRTFSYILTLPNPITHAPSLQSNPPPSIIMAKHHPDLIMCRKQPGIAIGRLCEKCDGKCVICDSYVRPCTLVRVCDECNYGSFQGRCVICGGVGISDAYYCKECTQQEKDRDGCPKIVNLGSAKTDLFYEPLANILTYYCVPLTLSSLGLFSTDVDDGPESVVSILLLLLSLVDGPEFVLVDSIYFILYIFLFIMSPNMAGRDSAKKDMARRV
ncbi:hypothetical protein F8388_011705, partial [Cannabis sativa]